MGPRAYTSPDLGKKETEIPPPHTPPVWGLGIFFLYVCLYTFCISKFFSRLTTDGILLNHKRNQLLLHATMDLKALH